jgi:hypothetical protein
VLSTRRKVNDLEEFRWNLFLAFLEDYGHGPLRDEAAPEKIVGHPCALGRKNAKILLRNEEAYGDAIHLYGNDEEPSASGSDVVTARDA